MKFSFSV